MFRACVAVSALTSWVLFSGAARADMGNNADPESKVAEAIQEEQDVWLQLDIPSNELGPNVKHDLIRANYDTSPALEVLVLDDRSFEKDDAVDVYEASGYGGSSTKYYVFFVADECVPAGHFHYRLSSENSYTTLWFDVEDTGDACLDQGEWMSDARVVGAGDGYSGCSQGRLGRDATAGALGLLMLGIGLAGLLVSRRRR